MKKDNTELRDTGGAAGVPGLTVHGPVVTNPWTVLASRPVLAVLTLLGLVTLLEVAPGLERWRLLSRPEPETPPSEPALAATQTELGEARLEAQTEQRPELAQPEQVTLPRAPQGPIAGPLGKSAPELELNFDEPPLPVVDAGGVGLRGFYRGLLETSRKTPGAVTRIVHFGDSIVTSDYVTGTLRRTFQKAFGDAGHGFVLIANPWPAYSHNDVYRFASEGWLVSRIVGPRAPDGWYGLGGVSFRAPPGARARFGTAKTGTFGRAASRFEVAYVEAPGGGRFALNLNGQRAKEIDTSGPAKKSAFVELTAPDGEHEVELVTLSGDVRVFGAVLERAGPGVVLDAIGVQGARVRFLDEQEDAHWAEQLRWRRPNLLVYQFGANESADGFAYPMEDYRRTLEAVLLQGKRAVPEAGCLVIGAMDRAEKKGETLRTVSVIPALVEEQRAVSAKVGCAFFDTFRAMGGHGSMAIWVARGLGQADLTHPTGAGSELLGRWIFAALMQGFDVYRKNPPKNDPAPQGERATP
jgi:hypothetical protein